MNRSSTALATLGVAVLALLTAPGVAQAAAPPTPAPVSAAAPDGYLYAWDGPNRTGDWCRWLGDDPDWGTCSGTTTSMRKRASSVDNRGYAGAYEDVDLFFETNYRGSHMCLWNGRYFSNWTAIYFPWDGKLGQGQSVDNNIASHRWSNNC
ncbi:hypothetical protein Sme01_47930 [Sphaerisporangium melleum]|uniref:Peptidase inhibitor family I36 n=1 Tax=Sphaerisporangium melleum TaxID=321316 RepID=A0A917VVL5_9ACTN|nr:peptidase inhibitor family I36 protein [Sphaerisporangium melleum]GGL18740.1 hypothetical protein GCM10007964_70940 [Sphaerisporangium melleum]GII72317.1 hypothetical protein Sme01_47930 [Sphaerisporangium melleum]